MKVYVLSEVEQEGASIRGVYASLEAAKAAAPAFISGHPQASLGEWTQRGWGNGSGYWRADMDPWTVLDIEEFEVLDDA